MVKGMYQHLRKTWKKPRENLGPLLKTKISSWREGGTVTRVEKPMRLDKARNVGYKAKKGFVVVRVKIKKGGRRRPFYGRRGRKPSKAGLVHFTYSKSLQWIAEERAAKRYQNLEVLNSYYVGEDGQMKFFEVILVDPSSPEIAKDPNMKWMTNPANRRRVLRGLTSTAKHSRGLK